MSKISRRLFLGTICSLVALSTISCAASRRNDSVLERSARPLRVMSYNIHIGRGMDGKFDLERIAHVIMEQSPDLVALQEVDVNVDRSARVDQAAELGRLTGMQVYFGKAVDHSGGGAYGQAILSRFGLHETKTHVLPGKPDRETRVAVEAIVDPPGMPRLRFLGTHLDHLPDESDRLQQARFINDLLKAEPNVPTILAGDLNARPESAAMQQFFEFWKNVSGGADEPTFPANEPVRRIDYVLVPKNQPWREIDHDVPEERIASDHRPVVVELRWTGR